MLEYLVSEVWWNSLWSMGRVLAGVSVAVIWGITLGLLRNALPERMNNNWAVNFLFESPKFVPPLAWLPFVIMYFGIGNLSACLIVFIGAFVPVFLNTYRGACSVPKVIRNTARSLEIDGWRYHWGVIFPAALPQIFTGIHLGLGMGWFSIIAAEMVSGQSGLGYSIQLNSLNLQYDYMAIDLLAIIVMGNLLHQVGRRLEQKTIPWHKQDI